MDAMLSFKDLLCALLMIFHLLARTAPLAATLKQEDCRPTVCGELSVEYPFWLGGQQPPECGYPSFNITCILNETALLNFFGNNYYVNNIFYHNRSILLSAAQFVDDPCRLPYYNLTYDYYPLSDSPFNKRVVFFLNCSSPLPSVYREVTCARYGRLAYYGGGYDASSDLSSLAGYYGGCVNVFVPVVGYSSTSRDADYMIPLRNGWLMDWVVHDCDACYNSGGACGYDTSTASFVCICADRIYEGTCNTAEQKRLKKRTTIIIGAFGSLSLLCLFLFLHLQHHKRSHGKHMQRIEAFLNEHASLTPKRYKYSQVKKMTKSFSNKLGQGGYGTVYKGSLMDGHLVAVKVLSDGSNENDGEEFINEVASISTTSHVNIVNLVGFCIEGSKRVLIYDYMPNGSLEKFISPNHEKTNLGPSIDCEKLHQIAVGIARGLEYLHRGCNKRIVHFDIKPHNILLDQDFCPKIADFGLAKLGRPKESKISMTGARGTAGYIAPEVFSRHFGSVSSKSDVYSYGMMVLEMVGAKRRFGEIMGNSSEVYFTQCIYDNFDEYCNIENTVVQIDEINKEMVRKMIIVGLWCIQIVPANRPTMSMVVDMLEGNKDLEMPPRA